MVNSVKQPKYKRGFHPNSRKNLLPGRWKPGQSGNPTGYSLTAALKQALAQPLGKPNEQSSVGELLVYSTLEGAIKREPTPFKEVWDRTEGKVPDKTIPTNAGSQVLNIIVVGGSQNLNDVLQQVRERTKQLAMGDA